MLTASTDMTKFDAGIAGFIQQLGVESKVVVAKESGELMKTLVKLTPSLDTKKFREFSLRQFATIGEKENSDLSRAKGGGKNYDGITWFSVDSKFLKGVADEKDMRGASVEEVRKLSYQITKSGRRINTPIKGHKTQRALIYQTILTKRSTVNKVIALKIKNRGRLKAGWLVSVFNGAIHLEGGNQPPGFVTRHSSGARGYYVNGIETPGFPTFTIANTAKGIGNSKNKMNAIAQSAVDIRGDAMAKNMKLYLSGKKFIGDYAK